jgi:hypothetical protein
VETEITVLVSSSPIPSHPSLAIIQETLDSIRYHLPDAKIIIMLDGVREEQKDREKAYHQHIMQLATKLLASKDRQVRLYPFNDFTHQAWMTMKTLETIYSPLILFVEHDTPLVDKPIDWPLLKRMIREGYTNHIRLHYDEQIHPEHQHLMRGKLTENLIKTVQWHQRPHLAHATWYEQILANNFTEKSRTWIEDKVYSPVTCAPWEEYKLTVYDPEGTGQNMKRSRDLNGRAGDKKYDPQF